MGVDHLPGYLGLATIKGGNLVDLGASPLCTRSLESDTFCLSRPLYCISPIAKDGGMIATCILIHRFPQDATPFVEFNILSYWRPAPRHRGICRFGR